MAYEPTEQKTGDIVTSARMNKIETALLNNDDSWQALEKVVDSQKCLTVSLELTEEEVDGKPGWYYAYSNRTYNEILTAYNSTTPILAILFPKEADVSPSIAVMTNNNNGQPPHTAVFITAKILSGAVRFTEVTVEFYQDTESSTIPGLRNDNIYWTSRFAEVSFPV